MSDDEKRAAPTTASAADPRTAEVLRALERARGTIAQSDGPTVDLRSESLLEALTSEVVALREERSRAASSADEITRRFADSTRSLERQAGVVAARLNQQRKQIAILSVVLLFLLLAGGPYLWDAHRLAQGTHDILQQILENQTKAQSAKGARR